MKEGLLKVWEETIIISTSIHLILLKFLFGV